METKMRVLTSDLQIGLRNHSRNVDCIGFTDSEVQGKAGKLEILSLARIISCTTFKISMFNIVFLVPGGVRRSINICFINECFCYKTPER